MRTITTFTIFSCFVIASIFMSGCSRPDQIKDLDELNIAMDKGDDGKFSDCSGEIPFTPTISPVSVTDYPGFDLALLVTGTAPDLPPGCGCATTTYTFNLALDYMFVQEVGVAYSGDQTMNVDGVYEDQSGFALEFRAPDGWNSDIDPNNNMGDNSFSVCIEAADGDIILFDFYGGTPGGPGSTSVIDNVGGICIVDNIGKENGK